MHCTLLWFRTKSLPFIVIHVLPPFLLSHLPSLCLLCSVGLFCPLLLGPSGLREFAFVCDSGVSEARGGVRYRGFVPSCEVKIIS